LLLPGAWFGPVAADFLRAIPVWDPGAVNLTDFFLQVGVEYDRMDGLNTPTQEMLKNAGEVLSEHTPGGMFIAGSGGRGMATLTPWVGWFDPDETDSPQRGVYVVYIFSENRERLALTLNQGMEYLRTEHGDKDARDLLRTDAEAIQSGLPEGSLARWSDPIDLGSAGARQKAYEAGNIACRMYDTADLPSESEMRDNLDEILGLYSAAVAVKRALLLAQPGAVSTPSAPRTTGSADPLANFQPKDSSDYAAHLTGRALLKSRKHESLVDEYGRFAASLGYVPSTEHPRDLVLRRGSIHVLVEAKVVYGGNATEAVRGAVGQLLSYSYFLYEGDNQPTQMALFTEPIGDAYVGFLEAQGIAAVWWNRGWVGSHSAEMLGLVDSDAGSDSLDDT
jgi:hypothetical protein